MAVRKVSIVPENMAFHHGTSLCSEAESVPEHLYGGVMEPLCEAVAEPLRGPLQNAPCVLSQRPRFFRNRGPQGSSPLHTLRGETLQTLPNITNSTTLQKNRYSRDSIFKLQIQSCPNVFQIYVLGTAQYNNLV